MSTSWSSAPPPPSPRPDLDEIVPDPGWGPEALAYMAELDARPVEFWPTLKALHLTAEPGGLLDRTTHCGQPTERTPTSWHCRACGCGQWLPGGAL